MDHHDLAGAIAMRVGIFLGGAAMSRPAGVADAVGAVERLKANDLFQVAQLAFGAADLQAISITADGNASRVITAILEAPQAIQNDRNDPLLTYISHDSAHAKLLLNECGEAAYAYLQQTILQWKTGTLRSPDWSGLRARSAQPLPRPGLCPIRHRALVRRIFPAGHLAIPCNPA